MKKTYAKTPLILFGIIIVSFVMDLLQVHASHNRQQTAAAPIVTMH